MIASSAATGAALLNANVGNDVYFKITIANTGNTTLTGINLKDVNTSNSGNIVINPLAIATSFTGDTNGNSKIDVGETWTIIYKQPFDPGQHINTATVTTDQGVTDKDDAYYYSLSSCGPGVGTPGFWSNLGIQFWDGNATNQTKSGPNFPTGELTYMVDSNKDGLVDTRMGLLIGDYNKNGITDNGEHTFFVNFNDAKAMINASQKQQGDGRWMLARDVVATWLNYLAGNNIDKGDNTTGTFNDPNSPKSYLQDAVDWLKKWGDINNDGKLEPFNADNWGANKIATSDARWSDNSKDGVTGNLHTAQQAHYALDHYNNDGTVADGGYQYACDRDDPLAMYALTLVHH